MNTINFFKLFFTVFVISLLVACKNDNTKTTTPEEKPVARDTTSTSQAPVATESQSKIFSPVTWNFSSKKVSDDTYEIRMEANIENGWHVYSQFTPAGGPIPTEVNFTKNPLVTPEGKIKEEGKMETKFEKMFKVDVKQYSNSLALVQTVKVKSGVKTSVKGTVKFMACDDKQCLPPKDVPFDVVLQ